MTGCTPPTFAGKRFMLILTSLLCFLQAASPANAQDPEEQAQIAWALERGRLLFGIDRAAWVATDDMMASIPDPVGAGLRGYFVEPADGGFDVVFFAGEEPNLVEAYRGHVASAGVVSHEIFPALERPPLTAAQRRLVQAVAIVRSGDRRGCSASDFNPLVIPPTEPDGPIDVYLLTPQTDASIPFGGHYRVTVASDGRILSERPFARSCLNMPPPPANSVAAFVTHLLDPIPTEIHVFSSLAIGQRILVGTNEGQRLWEVTGEGISLVEDSR